MFNFKKHTTKLTIRDITNLLHAYLGGNATVTFEYMRVYPHTKVTQLDINWLVTRDEVYTVRFDADYFDEILVDHDLATEFAFSLANRFKKMKEINSKIEEGSQKVEHV